MSSAQGIRAGKAYVELFADNNPLTRGLNQAAGQVKQFGRTVTAIGGTFLALGGAIVAPLVGAVKQFSDMGSHLYDLSQRTGASVEFLSALGLTAESAGASAESIGVVMKKMAQTIAKDAGPEIEEAKGALHKLGIEIDAIRGKTPEEQFRLLARSISSIKDPTERAGLALSVFGRGSVGFLPLFAQGPAAIEATMERFREIGAVMSGEDASAAKAFQRDMHELWSVLKMVTFQVGSALAPVLRDVVHAVLPWVTAAVEWVKENRQLVVVIAGIGAGLLALGGVLVASGVVLGSLGVVLGVVNSMATAVAGVIGGALTTAFGYATWYVVESLTVLGLFANILKSVVWDATMDLLHAVDAVGKTMQWLGDVTAQLGRVASEAGDTFAGAWQGIQDAIAGGDMGKAFEIASASIAAVWLDLVAVLTEDWLNFKDAFLDITNDISTGLAQGIATGVVAAVGVWNEMSTTMQNVWETLMGALSKTWLDFVAMFESRWVKVNVAIATGSIQAGNEAGAAVLDQLASEKAAIDRTVAYHRKQRAYLNDAVQKIGLGVIGNLGVENERDKAARHGASDDQLKAARDAATNARIDLDNMEEAASIDAAQARARQRTALPGNPGDEDEAMGHASKMIQGTFNASAVHGLLAGGSPMEKLARKADQQIKLLQKIADNIGGQIAFS
jgi:hypothetical protein